MKKEGVANIGQPKAPSNKKAEGGVAEAEDRKQWHEIEEATEYLVKTSKPGLEWHDLLGRRYEPYP